MGFDGFVISDWRGRSTSIPGRPTPSRSRTGVNAGIDMIMEPNASTRAVRARRSTDEVGAGRVPMARIDDAVARILTEKFELGLFEHPYTDRDAPAAGRLARRTARWRARPRRSRRCC